MSYNIAIDGPAGAGKSTIAKLVAREKGYIYVDTGALYRAIALHLLKNKIRDTDEKGIISACKDANITIGYEGETQQVYLNGENVTDSIREEAVGNMASVSSAIPQVRKQLLDIQRELAETNNVVMDGRDIGTHILPHAQTKIYLTASVETRAMRRYKELQKKDQACDLKKIEEDIRERDRRDMSRETAPLMQAEDAILVDSSDMTIEEVVKTIIEHCK